MELSTFVAMDKKKRKLYLLMNLLKRFLQILLTNLVYQNKNDSKKLTDGTHGLPGDYH